MTLSQTVILPVEPIVLICSTVLYNKYSCVWPPAYDCRGFPAGPAGQAAFLHGPLLRLLHPARTKIVQARRAALSFEAIDRYRHCSQKSDGRAKQENV